MHSQAQSMIRQPYSTSALDPSAQDENDFAALRQGDVAAYEAVFRRYYTALCSSAVRLTASWDDAEEVVQTVFSTLWQRHDQLRITTTVRAYLYAAVRNQALNTLKHRRVEELAADKILAAHGSAPLAPDLVLERDEITARIRAAVNDLPPRAREVLTLRWEHHMSYEEIGAVLGVRPNSAKMQQSRALAMLRERLSDLLPPAGEDDR